MSCTCCDEARQAPEHFRQFADGCLYCAARRIQYIQRKLQISPADKQKRCRAVLSQALEFGLKEQQIRAMAKQPEWARAPALNKAKKGTK